MFNVAILGYQTQGRNHHAPAFAKIPDCRIVAVCDVVEERAREGAERYGVPAYTDVDEMLDREAVDIADIPTGEQFRYELVMNCLRRGKHVFTEKPLAGAEGQYRIGPSDVPRAVEMVEEWQRRGVQFGVCFGLHASPNVRRVKEVIRGGELGGLRMIQARTAQGSWNHVIDLTRFLGGEVREVFAYADGEGMRDKVACLKFEGGAVGTLAVSQALSLQFQVKWVGELGEATADDIAGTASWRLHHALEVTRWDETPRTSRGSYGGLFDDLISDFVASIREGRPFVADGWAGLRHMEIDAAITGSVRTGRPVSVVRHRPDQGRTIFSGDMA